MCIYILKFTRDDGQSFPNIMKEFFVSKGVAESKANRLNTDLPDLCRYEVETLPLSWDDPNEYKLEKQNKTV